MSYEISKKAKRRYPHGTRYRCAQDDIEYTLNVDVRDVYKIYGLSENVDAGVGRGYLKYNNKWAEIISTPNNNTQEIW